MICAITLLPRLEFHHHDVAAAGVALAVEVSAGREPTNENVARSIYLPQLGLGRRLKPTCLETCEFEREFDPHAPQQLELIVNGSHKQNTS